MIAIRPDADRRARVGDVAWFHTLVRQVFLHRRKYIRHVLVGLGRDEWTKSDVDTWLESRGLSGQLRAESLNVEEFIGLADAAPRHSPVTLGISYPVGCSVSTDSMRHE